MHNSTTDLIVSLAMKARKTDVAYTHVWLNVLKLTCKQVFPIEEIPENSNTCSKQRTKPPNEGKETPVASLTLPVSTLCKQSPVVDMPEIWVLFFPLLSCVYVCAWVHVSLLELPLAKLSLPTPPLPQIPIACSLALSLRSCGRIDEQPDFPFILPDFLTERQRGEEEEWGKWSLSTITHSSLPWECKKNKKRKKKSPNVLAVTNRAIKLYGPAEHATVLMLWEVVSKLMT